MKNNETGEFELVLGNRQLLSVFFIGVFLFAVFFVMGYIVGRNSAPVPQTVAAHEGTTGAPAGGRPQAASPAVTPNATPAYEPPKDEPAAQAPPVAATQTKAEPPAAAPPSGSIPAAPEPAPGEMYLQVTSLKPQAAETVAKTLKEKGLPTSLAPGVAGNMRVWVGPYTDRGKLGEAKAELERLGFGPFVVKPGK